MELYPYQKRVANLLRNGQSVVLHAPTGAGKTVAGLWPFLEAWDRNQPESFPRQMIYSVPMRVLATQFFKDSWKLTREKMILTDLPAITVQTGERPDDPKLLGDMIFTTLDQTLSSALGVPYGLSTGQSNLNVGAILGSYLIFDEFHLFPTEAAKTTLQLLRAIGRIAPFLLMTATFSRTMLDAIAECVGAEPVLLDAEEVIAIETKGGILPRKERRYEVASRPLEAEDVMAAHCDGTKRSLTVCNTVDRATELYKAIVRLGARSAPLDVDRMGDSYDLLRAASSSAARDRLLDQITHRVVEMMSDANNSTPWVMLLHSRFERIHRQVKEHLLQSLWSSDGFAKNRDISLIVVATQVVEVGLNISSQVLHTEIAPAASILQRAGRCARYPGEQGKVYVYQVPENKAGQPNYTPYGTSAIEAAVCSKSWDAFCQRHGCVVPFEEEQSIVDEAHSDADAAMLQKMQEEEGGLWQDITDALVQGETSTRPKLIRRVDSRTVIAYEPPSDLTEEKPFKCEGISLWHGTLRGKVARLKELSNQLDLDWYLKYPIAVKAEEDSRAPVVYRWLPLESTEDVGSALLFAVNPRLVAYDPNTGLRLGVEGEAPYFSPPAVNFRHKPDFGDYELESYEQHIETMIQVFQGRRPIRVNEQMQVGDLLSRLQWPAKQLAQMNEEWHLPPDMLEKAVRLVIALHDVGKLDERWQKWASSYQQGIGEGQQTFLIVHTHFERKNEQHLAAQKRVWNLKPKTHAGEGADAAARILFETLDGKTYPGLYRAAITAIARHHSPRLDEARPYQLHSDAQAAVAGALKYAIGEACENPSQWLRMGNEAPNLQRRLLEPPPSASWSWWFQYFLLVRILRLCDGLSQEDE